MRNLYIGIDIGGSFIKYGYGSLANGIEYFSVVANDNLNRESIYERLQQIVSESISQQPAAKTIKAIGLGSPGIIDSKSGEVIGNCPNIPEWVGANPKKYLEHLFSLPVSVENDGDLMTYGESNTLKGIGTSVLGVTIGSGIGCGFVSDGKIFHNNHKSCLELGHCIVVPEGRKCLCGKKGCLETYSSAKSIIRSVKKVTNQTMSLEDILLLSRDDKQISNILEDAYQKLALGISNAIMLLGTDTIIIGGGITEIESFDIQPLIEMINSYLTGYFKNGVTVMPAKLKNRAAVWGGIILAEKQS